MSSRRHKPGRTQSLRPPEGEQWTWVTNTMLASTTYRALSIHARRTLDFLLYEHASHGGRENGNLAATYRQLEVWGVTANDIRKGLEELYVTGFVRLTREGKRIEGQREPARYALTWLPTRAGSADEAPPTHDWTKVRDRIARDGVGSYAQARAWLAREVKTVRRKTPVRPPATAGAAPHLQVVVPLKCKARGA